jgi:hypothetical protein
VISFLVVFASVKEKIPIPVIEAPPIEPSRTLSPPSEEPERSRRRKRTVSFSDVVDVRIIGPFYAEQMPRSGTGELFDRKTEHAVFDVRLTPHLSIMQLLHCKETVFENFATEKEHTVPVEPRTDARQIPVITPLIIEPAPSSSRPLVRRSQGKIKLMEVCGVPLSKAFTHLRKCGKLLKTKTRLASPDMSRDL